MIRSYRYPQNRLTLAQSPNRATHGSLIGVHSTQSHPHDPSRKV